MTTPPVASTLRLSPAAWAAIDRERERRGMSRSALVEEMAHQLEVAQAERDSRLAQIEARLAIVEALVAANTAPHKS